jgi:nitroreductase
VDRRRIRAAIVLALRAPSVHNTQPWSWRVGPDAVELYADRDRHLAATDPDRRDLLVSCGAALHHLRVALAADGFAVDVERLPDPEDRGHLATVRVAAGPPDPVLAGLAAAMGARRTDRRRTSRRPVPPDVVDALAAAAAREGALLVPVTQPARRRLLLSVLAEASVLQRRQCGYAAELQRWTHRPAGARDGVPAYDVTTAPVGARASSAQRPFGAAGLAQPPARPGHDPDDDAAVFLALVTTEDTALDRLRAGEAASAVLLTATRMGLATAPSSQVVEVGASRLRLRRDVLGVPEHPQLVLRVGWPVAGTAAVPASPRRRLASVLLDGN